MIEITTDCYDIKYLGYTTYQKILNSMIQSLQLKLKLRSNWLLVGTHVYTFSVE